MKVNSQKLVGVTGAREETEVLELLNIFKKHHNNGSILMNGIMINVDGINFLRKEDGRFFSPDKVGGLLVNDSKLFHVLHFVKSDGDSFASIIDKVASNIKEGWQGIQLNIPWPSLDEMKNFRRTGIIKRKNPFIILQIDATCFDGASTSRRMAKKLADYDRYVDHVLIDVSGFKKAEADSKFIERCVKDIKVYNPRFTIGIAGNLDGDSLLGYDRLIKHHRLSFDAGDKLKSQITSRFDMKKCEDYFVAASLVLNQ